MHSNFNPRQKGAPQGHCNQNESRNCAENNFNQWGMGNMQGQVIHSVEPPNNFVGQPFTNFGGPNYSQTFGAPPTFGPSFSNDPYLPPQHHPQEFSSIPMNMYCPSDRKLPPPHPSMQGQPINFPPPTSSNQYQGALGINLQSKSISEWVRFRSFPKHTAASKVRQKFEIHEYRLRLEACISDTKKLDKLSSAVKGNLENLSEEKWNELHYEMDLLKKKIESDLEYLNDPDVLASIQTQLEKRSKKRARLKRRNAEHREEKVKQENERKIVNQQIDDWMRAQEEKAANAKRDEQLKKEAQIVLSEVTRRTTEAKNQLELLSGLEKIRHLKSQLPQNKGDSKTIDSVIVFKNLKEMWSAKLKEYKLEEQGLRVMLSEANLETIKSNKSIEKEALTKWKKLLFGDEDSHQFYTDLNELILIRSQWDKFAVPQRSDGMNFAELSSLIPVGWVLPSAPSNSAWNRFLVDD